MRWRPGTPVVCVATIAAVVMAFGGATHADPRPVKATTAANRDGHYLTIGPVAGAAYLENSWYSFAGAELSWMRLRERHTPAALGLDVGAVGWGSLPGGRLWSELQIAFDHPLPVDFGLSFGVTVEVDQVRPPRWGAQGTLWFFTGVIPYLRVGTLEEHGVFGEVGVMIKLPVKIRY